MIAFSLIAASSSRQRLAVELKEEAKAGGGSNQLPAMRRKTGRIRPEGYDLSYDLNESAGIERLYNIWVRVKRVAFPNVRRRSRARQHDGWDQYEVRIVLSRGQEFLAVHAGHIDVEENDIWSSVPGLMQKLHRLKTVIGNLQLACYAPPFERTLD
jgi:hypothetical protein